MGKSYKKTRVCISGTNKDNKKFFNRKLRRMPIDEDFGNGNWFKKKNCSWDIVDIRCYIGKGKVALEEWIKAERHHYEWRMEHYKRKLEDWKEEPNYSFPKPTAPNYAFLASIWRTKDVMVNYDCCVTPGYLKSHWRWEYSVKNFSTFEELVEFTYDKYYDALSNYQNFDGKKKPMPQHPGKFSEKEIIREFYRLYRNK